MSITFYHQKKFLSISKTGKSVAYYYRAQAQSNPAFKRKKGNEQWKRIISRISSRTSSKISSSRISRTRSRISSRIRKTEKTSDFAKPGQRGALLCALLLFALKSVTFVTELLPNYA